MAYQKKQPKIMSDGNIALVGMIIFHKTYKKSFRIIRTNPNIIMVADFGWYNKQLNLFNCWVCCEINIRKATFEEKKQYWAELAQQ